MLVPGDHLQLLYHFWLASDMLAGNTPFFYNLYEFNTGNDADIYRPDTCFFPFPILYAFGSWIGGRAFGYNLTAFLSLWITYLLTWLLTSRYCSNRWLAALAALPVVFLPYRWHVLMGGSPTGLTVMFIPMILFGIDVAVRESRVWGGILAGIAILFAGMSEAHVLFFGALSVPVWCVIAFASRTDFRGKRVNDYARLAVALMPVLFFFAGAYWISHHLVQRVAASSSAAGREIAEIGMFSPHWDSLFSRAESRFGNQIFIGCCLPALIVIGLFAVLAHALGPLLPLVTPPLRRLAAALRPGAQRTGSTPYSFSHRRNQTPPQSDQQEKHAVAPNTSEVLRSVQWRSALLMLMLALAVVGIVSLALGPFGPYDGVSLVAARKYIPPYRMIRQTTKIFCLMPTFLAVASALAFSSVSALSNRRAWKVAIPIIFIVLMFVDYRERIRTSVCLLQKEQGAYRCVRDDARHRGIIPRALAITLWPGDSSQSSLYEYYASLYRIRMINGYSPIVRQDYMTNVYLRFEGANQGYLSNEQLNALHKMGIDYLLLHEDTFPEVVSPFPVTFTLKNLLNNPRLDLINRSDQVWTFRIMPEPERRYPIATNWTVFCAARRWEAETCQTTNVVTVADNTASAANCISLTNMDSAIETRITRMSSAPKLRYMARVRGTGSFAADIVLDDKVAQSHQVPIETNEWTWISLPAPDFDGYRALKLRIGKPSGVVHVDYILLTAGEWDLNPAPKKPVTLPAPVCFHAGHIDLDKNSVFFEAGKRTGTMFYGPKLPLEKGKYRLELRFSAPAPAGTDLGELIVDRCEDQRVGSIPVLAGKPACFDLDQTVNLPLNVVFSYSGKSDMDLTKLIITRLE